MENENEAKISLETLQENLEAVLFAMGEPAAFSRLMEILETDAFSLQSALSGLEARLQDGGGLCLVTADDKYQLATRPSCAAAVRRALEIKRNIPLSPAAFEVLAIVAYRQPVTKAYIEQTRGVDCSAVLANLISKGLVEERGRLDLPGRPLLYGTSDNFLRCFGIGSLDELPPLEEISAEAALQDDPEESGAEEQLSIDPGAAGRTDE